MSIIDTTTTPSIDLQQAVNCMGATTYGCPPYYYPQLVGDPDMNRRLSVEAVAQGYIVEACWGGKRIKRVALGPAGLAEILSDWAMQFECKSK